MQRAGVLSSGCKMNVTRARRRVGRDSMEAGPVSKADAGSEKTPGMGRAARVLVGLRRSYDVASRVDAATPHEVHVCADRCEVI